MQIVVETQLQVGAIPVFSCNSSTPDSHFFHLLYLLDLNLASR